jgi:hypothetical protein
MPARLLRRTHIPLIARIDSWRYRGPEYRRGRLTHANLSYFLVTLFIYQPSNFALAHGKLLEAVEKMPEGPERDREKRDLDHAGALGVTRSR